MAADRASPARLQLAAASAIGTTLEWYDFTVYNVMAALVFNAVFFPAYEPMTGTLLAFSTYAVGYFSRPVGGLIFGHLGDRLGRRFVLAATLTLMGVASCLIGLLPPYRMAGLISSAVLVLLRFAQGAAIGGEWAGAVLLALESGGAERRGRSGSFAQIGPACGTILGLGAVSAVSSLTSALEFERWGWRLPFLVSAPLVIFGLWLRRGVGESAAFRALQSNADASSAPVREVVRHHLRGLLTSIAARAGPDVFYALVMIFTLSYLTTILHMSRPLALGATVLGAACNAVCIPVFASWSDRVGRRLPSIAGALLAALWVFVYFWCMSQRRAVLIDLAVMGGLALHAMMYGPQAALIAEQFPTRVRYAGCSIAYTFTGLVAGGVAPLLFGVLYSAFHDTRPLAGYVCSALALTAIVLWRTPETARLPLREA